MKIINKSKNAILAYDLILADTPFKRMKGLLGRKELKEGQAIILKPCNSIHTFFMRFPIDVVFVDKKDKIVKVISALNPNRLTGIYFSAQYAIELPSGTIQLSQTIQGDTIIREY